MEENRTNFIPATWGGRLSQGSPRGCVQAAAGPTARPGWHGGSGSWARCQLAAGSRGQDLCPPWSGASSSRCNKSSLRCLRALQPLCGFFKRSLKRFWHLLLLFQRPLEVWSDALKVSPQTSSCSVFSLLSHPAGFGFCHPGLVTKCCHPLDFRVSLQCPAQGWGDLRGSLVALSPGTEVAQLFGDSPVPMEWHRPAQTVPGSGGVPLPVPPGKGDAAVPNPGFQSPPQHPAGHGAILRAMPAQLGTEPWGSARACPCVRPAAVPVRAHVCLCHLLRAGFIQLVFYLFYPHFPPKTALRGATAALGTELEPLGHLRR